MTERPILMSPPMVVATLNRTKTQTRRVCKPAPVADARFVGGHFFPGKRKGASDISVDAPYVGLTGPYGQPGDRLWVRETFFAFGRWETRFSAKKGRDEWHFIDMTLECGHQYAYPADGRQIAPHRRTAGTTPTWWKRPAIFMPRVASRITLEIADVRVERLQDISDDDLEREGLQEIIDAGVDHDGTPRDAWRALWTQINGAASWAANPWVWVVEFKRVA